MDFPNGQSALMPRISGSEAALPLLLNPLPSFAEGSKDWVIPQSPAPWPGGPLTGPSPISVSLSPFTSSVLSCIGLRQPNLPRNAKMSAGIQN